MKFKFSIVGEAIHFKSGTGSANIRACYETIAAKFAEFGLPNSRIELVPIDMNNKTEQDALVISSDIAPINRLQVIFKVTNMGNTCLFSVYKQVKHISWFWWVFTLRPSLNPLSNVNGNVESSIVMQASHGFGSKKEPDYVQGSLKMRNMFQLMLFRWQQPKLFQLEYFQTLNYVCDVLTDVGDTFIK
nr:hypothetical protein [Candidatus Sigynarchaeota archaeon]